jgi:PAS domain S-box-containing protein
MEKAKAEELPLSKILPDMDVYSILMQTPVAICIFRGKEYTIEFANDFYLQILGESIDIIGKPLFESFPELKNQGFDKLIDGVMESGIPHIINEHAAIISRDDKESLCFFNCVYQPMREQSGAITGVIVVFTEVTELVLAKNKNFENQQKISEELFFSKKELAFQKEEKGKRAAELGIANKELAFQKEEKGKRAAELGIANKELAFQDDEKEKRAVELIIANKELIFQNDEKEKRAAELIIANKELIFQNDEKGKRADELIVVNKKLEFQNKEKEKRADELFIANQELIFQTGEKEKRAAELVIADIELDFQNKEKEKRELANLKLEAFSNSLKLASQYSRSLIESSLDPLVTISDEGKITDVNEASIKITGIDRDYLIGTDFSNYFTEPDKAAKGYQQVFAKGFVADYPLTIKHKNGKLTDVMYNASVYKDDKGNVLGVFAAARDVTAQKLLSNYSLSLIEASRDPLFTISPEGKITDMNEATVRVTGVSRHELIGTDFFNYFTQPNKAKEGYQEVFDKGFVADYPLTIMDGKLTDVLFNGSTYKDDRGNVLGAVVVARDITDQKRIEKELIEAKVAAELATVIAEEAKRKAEDATRIAEDAVKSKQQFLSNMSHEIRTPMNAIIGFTKVVLKTELSAKQKEYLTAIKMSGDALIVLINDILDLAKVDAGKMTFENTPFKMASSISAMLHLFETKIQEKNLELTKEYDRNIPEVLIGDPVRLHQIILNLVSNAVKFTAKGRIMVRVKLVNEDEENVSIEFAVSDTGIGISENKMTKVFDNFQQASSNTARLFGGTGLGLAIVKQLVEQQGGVVEVKSTLDVGSIFSFTLDFQKTAATAEMETEIIELNTAIKNIKVLVVEDMALNQLLMRTILDDFGFERDIAANGKIAVEKLTQRDVHGALQIYDIILMDLQMPEMNGFEATEYIRNTLKSKIPIIALTADVTTVDLAKCKAVGMNDYLAKPIDERLLYSKIVGLVKKPIAHNVKKENILAPIKKVRCINLDYLHKMTKSNPTLILEMIAVYLEQTPFLINEMKSSFQEKNWVILQSVLHKMIPSFSIMGINTDFSYMANDILKYTRAELKEDDIAESIERIENICLQACEELEEEVNKIKVDKA